MAAQYRLQVLAGEEAPPEPAAVPQHQREQPDLANHARLVGELHCELGKVDLRLLAGRGLEPPLERGVPRQAHLAQEVGHCGVGAFIAQLPDLAQKPRAAEIGKGLNAFLQVAFIGLDHTGPWLPRPINWRLQPQLEILLHRLPVAANLPRDRGDAETLVLQILDQDNLPPSLHLPAPVVVRSEHQACVPRQSQFRIDEVRNWP